MKLYLKSTAIAVSSMSRNQSIQILYNFRKNLYDKWHIHMYIYDTKLKDNKN